MENASKALTMAGSMLIAIIVISLLVVFFNKLQNLQKTELNKEEVEQAVEFNETYDVYYRDVYGSELLSIANKIKDYNLRESEISGYTEIELEVNITKDLDKELLKKGTYNSIQLVQKIKNVVNKEEKTDEKQNNAKPIEEKAEQVNEEKTSVDNDFKKYIKDIAENGLKQADKNRLKEFRENRNKSQENSMEDR